MSSIGTPQASRRERRAHPYHHVQVAEEIGMTPSRKLVNKHLLVTNSEEDPPNIKDSVRFPLSSGIHTRLSTAEDAYLAHQQLDDVRIKLSSETLKLELAELKLLNLISELKQAQQDFDRCTQHLAALNNDAGIWRAVLRGNGISSAIKTPNRRSSLPFQDADRLRALDLGSLADIEDETADESGGSVIAKSIKHLLRASTSERGSQSLE